MPDTQGLREGGAGAARIQAAQSEIELLLRQLVCGSELKVFAYRWGSEVLPSGRELCNLTLYFEDQSKSLSFDRRDLRDREPEFWLRTVPELIRREVPAAQA
jgi:hypothetical protein